MKQYLQDNIGACLRHAATEGKNGESMFQNEDPQEQCSGCKLMVRFLTRFVPPAAAKHLSDAWLARKHITYQYLKQLVAQKLIQRLDMYYQTG